MDVQALDLLGGERVFGASVRSNLDLARATREGLPVEAVSQLADFIGTFRTDDSCVAFLAEIKIPGKRLSPGDSDRVVRTASVLAQAIGTLGDGKKAVHWLTTPNRALGGEVPLTLLDTSAGKEEVEAILGRIEYGVYS